MITAKWPAMIHGQYEKSLDNLFLDEMALILYAIGTNYESLKMDDRLGFMHARGRRIAESLPNLRTRPSRGTFRELLAWAREGVRELVARDGTNIITRTASRLNRYVRLEISRAIGRHVTGTPFAVNTLTSDWVAENTKLIRSVDFTEQIGGIIEEGLLKGSSVDDIRKELESKAKLPKAKAALIAVDQTGKLYSQLTEHRHKEQGIFAFIWITKKDLRVRPSHKRMHGRTFSWDNLPVVDGEKTAPGRPIRCRCIANPALVRGS